MSEAQISARGV